VHQKNGAMMLKGDKSAYYASALRAIGRFWDGRERDWKQRRVVNHWHMAMDHDPNQGIHSVIDYMAIFHTSMMR
jgi:hypothetical protein